MSGDDGSPPLNLPLLRTAFGSVMTGFGSVYRRSHPATVSGIQSPIDSALSGASSTKRSLSAGSSSPRRQDTWSSRGSPLLDTSSPSSHPETGGAGANLKYNLDYHISSFFGSLVKNIPTLPQGTIGNLSWLAWTFVLVYGTTKILRRLFFAVGPSCLLT